MESSDKSCQLHVHISMEDRPGILAEALQSIVRCKWNVLDIKQFVFNGLLNLSLLLDGNDSGAIEPLRKALAEFEERSGLKISIHPWKKAMRPDAPYKHRSVVTLLGASIGSEVLWELTQTLASRDINILRIEQLDYGDQHVIEFVIGTRQTHSSLDVLNALVRFKEKFQVDLAVQDDTLFRRNKRLIVFDADMTFLQCEVIDEMGKLAGVGTEMAEITRSAMNGEMDFKEALEKRVRLLEGLGREQLEELFERIPLTPGATDLVTILKYLGYKIAIVSGGFQFFIEKLRQKYGLDYGFANQLKIENGAVTGELEGDVIDALAKERILIALAEKEGFTLKQVVAVGDGANDIHMLACAGLGIAFNAKPIVQQHARASINRSNLELILYFLGYNGSDLQELRSLVKRKGLQRFPVP
ncbi:MAG: phosphoserine phosphatase SerB [Nitrospinaceae bacterium]|nr:MAG: phosphoserine phosphatase SerB [Nitrospinaceae bacterium]